MPVLWYDRHCQRAEQRNRVIRCIAGTVSSLCRKLNVPKEETDAYISKIRKERKKPQKKPQRKLPRRQRELVIEIPCDHVYEMDKEILKPLLSVFSGGNVLCLFKKA